MSDNRTDEDIDRERDEVVRRMLNTPPKPRKAKKKAKKKAKADEPKT